MRKVNLKILFFVLILPGFLLAQQPDTLQKAKAPVRVDSTKKVTKNLDRGKKSAKDKDVKLKGFVDKNANGIDDRLEQTGKHGMKKKKTDFFIDKDGDGICDGRESAIGLKKIMRHRHRGKMQMP